MISGQLTQEDEDDVEAELEAILDVKQELPEVPIDELPETEKEKVPVKPQRVKEKVAVEAWIVMISAKYCK